MKQKNGHSILSFREQGRKVNIHSLNGGSELRELIDTSLTRFPALVIQSGSSLEPEYKLPVKVLCPLLLEAIQPIRCDPITTVRLRVLIGTRCCPRESDQRL